jgi:hypothetical protein
MNKKLLEMMSIICMSAIHAMFHAMVMMVLAAGRAAEEGDLCVMRYLQRLISDERAIQYMVLLCFWNPLLYSTEQQS